MYSSLCCSRKIPAWSPSSGESARGTPLRLTHGVCLTAPLSHVLALRLAGGFADRRAATALEVGGTSGRAVEIIPVYTVGEGRRTFGVRGFQSESVYGTRAAAASLEYRAPFVRGGRGRRLLPFFFERSSLTAFAEAGVAFGLSFELALSDSLPCRPRRRSVAPGPRRRQSSAANYGPGRSRCARTRSRRRSRRSALEAPQCVHLVWPSSGWRRPLLRL